MSTVNTTTDDHLASHSEDFSEEGLPDGIGAQSYPTPVDNLNIHEIRMHDHPERSERSEPTESIKPSSWYHSNICVDHGDLMLFACSFCTGLVDSSMFVAYSTFVSMQTGNTIFLTLAISTLDPKPDAWMRPFWAVILFCVGSAFFSRLFIYLGSPRRRLALVINFAIQTIFVTIAAAIIQTGAINGSVPATYELDGKYSLALVPIVLVSFQSAGQVVTSRALEVGEIPTVVITSMLCDLMSDPHLFAPPMKNIKRNRRAAGFMNTFIGGVIGGVMARQLGGIAPALWMAAGIKLCMTLAWVVWPSEKEQETKKKQSV